MFPLLVLVILASPLLFALTGEDATPLEHASTTRSFTPHPVIPPRSVEDPSIREAGPAEVTVGLDGFTVNGEALGMLKCVRYQPVPAGKSPAWGYAWARDAENYMNDLPLISALNANVVAVSSGAAAEPHELQAFMDAAYGHALRVIITVDGPNHQNASRDEVREWFLSRVDAAVSAYKDHPALLAWQLGNEVDWMYPGDVREWFELLEEGARHVKEEDPMHPVLAANNPVTDQRIFVEESPSVDALGLNVYALTREGMHGYFRDLADTVQGVPLLATEFGVDSWDERTEGEYERVQARVLVSAWRGLEDARAQGVPLAGGCVHEWSDQWWKDDKPGVHGSLPGWVPPDHSVLPDETLNEQWFGLVRITADDTAREARLAYERLAQAWAPEPARPPGEAQSGSRDHDP